MRHARGRTGECQEAMTTQGKVRDLQRALYRAAKADPRRQFHERLDSTPIGSVSRRALVAFVALVATPEHHESCLENRAVAWPRRQCLTKSLARWLRWLATPAGSIGATIRASAFEGR
jgi:hypothetical protein